MDDDGPRFTLPDEDDHLTVFLGPDVDSIDEVHAFVAKNFDYFFEHWLEGWCTDPKMWPQRRTRRMFKEWFDVRIYSVVEDTVDAPLELD
jgi:hypothetical protein